jgi:hypothetical protein
MKIRLKDDVTELFLTVQVTAGKCSNERKFENLDDISLGVAGRSPVVDGPCGCHPP